MKKAGREFMLGRGRFNRLHFDHTRQRIAKRGGKGTGVDIDIGQNAPVDRAEHTLIVAQVKRFDQRKTVQHQGRLVFVAATQMHAG